MSRPSGPNDRIPEEWPLRALALSIPKQAIARPLDQGGGKSGLVYTWGAPGTACPVICLLGP